MANFGKSLWDNLGKFAEFDGDGNLIWLREDKKRGNKVSSLPTPMVVRDIEPYKSMITGEMITSRSIHRDHLKQHNCVEVGNDTSHLKAKPAQHNFKNSKKRLAEQLADVSDKQLSKMIAREIKNRRMH